jgi:hypothetical protein
MDPKELLNNPEQIKNLISLLQSLLPNVAATEEPSTTKRKKKAKSETQKIEPESSGFNTNIRTKNKRSFQPSNINKFEKMSEFSMHKDDHEVDKKLAKHPPVARTRDFEPISVICRVCGKTEIVNPSLVHEGQSRYKCNSCSTQAG